jgi:hypothetical protein
VQFDQMTHDREPEPHAAVAPLRTGFTLPEPIEDMWQKVGGDS